MLLPPRRIEAVAEYVDAVRATAIILIDETARRKRLAARISFTGRTPNQEILLSYSCCRVAGRAAWGGCGHPGWRPAASPISAAGQSFEAYNSFLDLLALSTQFRYDLRKVHLVP